LTTTIKYDRHDMYLYSQAHGELGAHGWDMTTLTRIINQSMTVAAQQLRHDPTSNVEDLLGLDKTSTDDLWRLDFESVQNLKGM
jgi:hypothetical protein